jgi:outer membrane protein assembly factor BamB
VEAAQDVAIAVASVGIDSKVFIRGYDLHSGAIRWTTLATLFAPQQILVRNGKLVIVGYGPGSGPLPLTGIILVFDASTGSALWNTSIDLPGSETTLFDVDEGARFIVVIGRKGTPVIGSQDETIIRSYRLRDGQLRWELTESGILATQIRIVNEVAVVAGSENGQGFLAAYRSSDGIRQWRADAASVPFSFSRLAITPTAVFASGLNFVGAFNAGTGDVLWSKSGSFGNPETANRLIPVGGNLVTVGTHPMDPPFGSQQLVIHVFDAITGDLVTEDVRESGSDNVYTDAALLNGRLAVVGRIAGGALVRVYDVQTGIQP